MPAPSDLNRKNEALANPFEEVQTRVNEFTAREIIVLQNRLDKQLGPEYISSRPGAGGAKVHYIAAEKVINLANEVFGFNGWSSEVKEQRVDFCDLYENGKVSLGVSTIVRVSLKDGTFHEDVGYGHIENCKGKAAAFEKAKKESATDALKRALRNFGNVLGNCLYDKDYLNRVTKVKVAPSRWDAENLHRHPDFAPIKRQSIADHDTDIKPPALPNGPGAISNGTEYDDEFGGDLFDEVDMSGGNPDEVIIPARPSSRGPSVERIHTSIQAPTGRSVASPIRSSTNEHPPRPVSRTEGRMPPPSVPNPGTRAPQDKGNNQPQQRDTSGSSGDSNVPQPISRSTISNTANAELSSPSHTTNSNQINEPSPPVGFITSRNAAILTSAEPPAANVVANLPSFNPVTASNSIRKTSGINHSVSRPILRQAQQAAAKEQDENATESVTNSTSRPMATNFVNPSSDLSRRIGMPTGASSPLSNRSPYRPPGMTGTKRPLNSVAGHDDHSPNTRPPLADVSNKAQVGSIGDTTGNVHEIGKKIRNDQG